MSESVDEILGGYFGGNDGDIVANDDENSMPKSGGAFRAISHLSEGGKVLPSSWISLALSIAAILALFVLLMPWLLPNQWESLMKGSGPLCRLSQWLNDKDTRVYFVVLAAYFAWHEVTVWQHWK